MPVLRTSMLFNWFAAFAGREHLEEHIVAVLPGVRAAAKTPYLKFSAGRYLSVRPAGTFVGPSRL
jgi:hypothetical protein